MALSLPEFHHRNLAEHQQPTTHAGPDLWAMATLSSTGSAAMVHTMLAFEFGKGHAPNVRAAFEINPRKQVGFLDLKLAAQRKRIVVIDKFHGHIDAELVKRRENQFTAIA